MSQHTLDFKLIAHRGNTHGVRPSLENSPDYVMGALAAGYEIEVDVWRDGRSWLLGHDQPMYPVGESFLCADSVWCHAKNFSALQTLLGIDAHCFWHDRDMCTLTSEGYVWSLPHSDMGGKMICVLPGQSDFPLLGACAGVCADNLESIETFLLEDRT